MFIQQDLEGEPTLDETPAPDAEVAPVTPAPVTGSTNIPAVAFDDGMIEETPNLSPSYLRYAGIVLFMMTVPCAVYVCGGPRLTLLRRLVRKTRAGGYRRVNADDDVEK